MAVKFDSDKFLRPIYTETRRERLQRIKEEIDLRSFGYEHLLLWGAGGLFVVILWVVALFSYGPLYAGEVKLQANIQITSSDELSFNGRFETVVDSSSTEQSPLLFASPLFEGDPLKKKAITKITQSCIARGASACQSASFMEGLNAYQLIGKKEQLPAGAFTSTLSFVMKDFAAQGSTPDSVYAAVPLMFFGGRKFPSISGSVVYPQEAKPESIKFAYYIPTAEEISPKKIFKGKNFAGPVKLMQNLSKDNTQVILTYESLAPLPPGQNVILLLGWEKKAK